MDVREKDINNRNKLFLYLVARLYFTDATLESVFESSKTYR
jgi:hypothetical protein